jgi:hypothetical protein
MHEPLYVHCWIDGAGPTAVHLGVTGINGRLCLGFRGGTMLEVFVAGVDIDSFVDSFSKPGEPVSCLCKANDTSYRARIGVGVDDQRRVMLLHLQLSDTRGHTQIDVALTQEQATEVRARAISAAPPRPRDLAPLMVSALSDRG